MCLPELVKYPTGQHSSPNRSYVQCPFCNKQYHQNVDEFPKNRIIIQLLEASNGNINSIHPPSIPTGPSAPPMPMRTQNMYNNSKSISSQYPNPLPYPSYPQNSYPSYPSTMPPSSLQPKITQHTPPVVPPRPSRKNSAPPVQYVKF